MICSVLGFTHTNESEALCESDAVLNKLTML